jgi:hypothetical protein
MKTIEVFFRIIVALSWNVRHLDLVHYLNQFYILN